MSFEDLQKTVMHIDSIVNKNKGDTDSTSGDIEMESEVKENDPILKGNKDLEISINLKDLK